MSELYEAYGRVAGAVEETKKFLLDNEDHGYEFSCRIDYGSVHPNIHVSIAKRVCGRVAESDLHVSLWEATKCEHDCLMDLILSKKKELEWFVESQKPKPDIDNYACIPRFFCSTPVVKANAFYDFRQSSFSFITKSLIKSES